MAEGSKEAASKIIFSIQEISAGPAMIPLEDEKETGERDRLVIDGVEASCYITAMEVRESDNILVKKAKRLKASFAGFVQLSGVGNREIYICVNSLAHRLLLGGKELYRMLNRKSEFPTVSINQIAARTLLVKELSAEKNRILGLYEERDKSGKLYRKDSKEPSIGITKATLEKVLDIAFRELYLNPEKRADFVLRDQEEFVIRKSKRTRKIRVLIYSKRTPIKRGAFASVDKVFDAAMGIFIALKIAKAKQKTQQAFAESDVQRDVKVIRELEGHDAADFVDVAHPIKGHRIVASIQPLHRGNLKQYLTEILEKADKDNKEMRIHVCALLQQAFLRFAHEKKYIHNDLKLENILFDLDLDKNELILKIRDLGDARQVGQKGQYKMQNLRTHGHLSEIDFSDINKAIAGKNGDQFEAAVQKKDIFCLGDMFYEILAGHFPFEKQDIARETGAVSSRAQANLETIADKYGQETAEFIGRLLDTDPSERPSFEEIRDFNWEGLLKEE